MLPEIIKLYPENPQQGVEKFYNILSGKKFVLEHILSNGEVCEEGFWFDQEKKEWAALIKGKVTMEFEDGILELKAGDSLIFKPHQKHKIIKTTVDATWVAIHFEEDEN
jgi:cupin 2 domain-containing protein